MKKKIALLLVISILFGIAFGSTAVEVNADEEHEITDQYDSDTMLAEYSTAEIVAMYPEFSDYLAEELRALNTDIDVRDYDFTKENIGAVFFSVVCENPDIFYVFPISFNTTASTGSGKILSIRPEFYFDIEDIPSKIREFNQRVDSILAGMDTSWNDIIKARYLHDILAQYTEYDTKYETISSSNYELYRVQMRIYTSYGAIVDNNAVCEGYSMAYKYLLSRAGIEAYYVQSVKKRHAWTMVKINNNYYHVDITHDDPTYDTLGRVNHDSFLKSDNYYKNDNDNEHIDWITNLKASDTSYDNAWWHDVCTVIYRYNGYDYYIDQHYTGSVYAALTQRNISTGETKIIKTITTRWMVQGQSNTFWDRAFSYLTADSNYMYYNDTSSVYRRSISSGATEKVYTKPSSVSGDIYGLAFKSDGLLYITVKDSPNDKGLTFLINISVTEPTSESSSDSNPSGYTDPSSNDTIDPSSGGSTDPSSGDVTDPSSGNITDPTASTDTEPITAPSTQEEPPKPLVIKYTMSMYLKHKASVTLTPKANYTYSSDNKSIVTVSKSGVITAQKAGKAVVTAKSVKNIFKITVTVKNPKLNYTKKTIKKKKSFKLKVIGGSGTIVFKNSNSKVLSITKSGKVTGKKKGKATITVKVRGLSLKCKVTVR